MRRFGRAKHLMPANYTLSGEFDHDAALGAKTLPSLQPVSSLVAMTEDECWASIHKVRRAVNGVRYRVRLATEALSGVDS